MISSSPYMSAEAPGCPSRHTGAITMAIRPAPIDGYDWTTADNLPTYPFRDRQDACRRAARWRRHQAPAFYRHDEPSWELVDPVPVDDHGWLHVGTIMEWNRTRLRVCWHPDTDAVRVERPPQPPAPIEVPPPPAIPPAPITFTANITTSLDTVDIRVKLRFLPSPGREALTFPAVSMTVRPPPDMTRTAWKWTTVLAGHRLNPITVPDAFLDTPPGERLPMFREAIYAYLRQMRDRGGRRR